MGVLGDSKNVFVSGPVEGSMAIGPIATGLPVRVRGNGP